MANLKQGIKDLLENPEVDSIDDLDEIKVHQKNGNIITLPKEEEKKFKVGQYDKKEAWNKQIDEWQKAQPEKKDIFEKWRNFDDEKIEFTLAMMELIGGK